MPTRFRDEQDGGIGEDQTFVVPDDNFPMDMLDFGDAMVAGTDDPTTPELVRKSSRALYRSLKDNLDQPSPVDNDDSVSPEPGSPPAMRGWTTEDLTDKMIAQRGGPPGSWGGGRQSAKGFRDVTVARFQEELVLHTTEGGGKWRWKGLFYFVLALNAKTFHFFFVTLPDFTASLFPLSDSVFSCVTLYIFLQVSGLLGGFLIISTSVMITRAVLWEGPAYDAGLLSDAGMLSEAAAFPALERLEEDVVARPGQFLAWCAYFMSRQYVNFSILACVFLTSKALYNIGFEMYGDFPRVRALLDPRRYKPVVDSTHETPHEARETRNLSLWGNTLHVARGRELGAKKERAHNGSMAPMERRGSGVERAGDEAEEGGDREHWQQMVKDVQRLFLISPLVVLISALALLSFAPRLLRASFADSPPEKIPEMVTLMMDTNHRLHRSMRFTLLIGLLQWAQQFHCQFPRWYRSLAHHSSRKASKVIKIAVLLFGPISGVRLVEWGLFPRQPSSFSRGIHYLQQALGVPGQPLTNVELDNLLMLAFAVIFLLSSRMILNLPSKGLFLAGWKKDLYKDQELWLVQTRRFKGMFVVPMALHFVRGVLSPKLGFVAAQYDSLLISTQYPLLLTLVWMVAYCTVVLRPRHVRTLPIITGASALVCSLARLSDGAYITCWLYMAYGTVAAIAARANPRASKASDDALHSAAKRMRVGPRQPYGLERNLSSRIARTMVTFVFGFAVVMFFLAAVSRVQTVKKWFPRVSFIHMESIAPNHTRIAHAVSRLELYKAPKGWSEGWASRKKSTRVEYAVCHMPLWGLSAVDWGLLSIASYFPPTQVASYLAEVFPPSYPISPRAHLPSETEESERDNPAGPFWTEIQVSKELTVISVRGTEFWRVSDYLEDVRLWTEPVVFSILAIFFPTINAWSPSVHGTVTDLFQSFLDWFGVPDPAYKYEVLSEHIQKHVQPRLAPGAKLILTGHSLGGGIAQIVGALVGAPVIAFQPPGIYQSLSKHLYRNAKDKRQVHVTAHNLTVTVLVENDFVGRLFDSHGGLVQTVTCETDHLGPLGCHLLENTVCNLIESCRDPRWASCSFAYDPSPITRAARTHWEESFGSASFYVDWRSWLPGLVYALGAGTLGAVVLSFLSLRTGEDG